MSNANHDMRAPQPHPMACATVTLVNEDGDEVICNLDQVPLYEKKGYRKPEPIPAPTPAAGSKKKAVGGGKPTQNADIDSMPVVKIQSELEGLGVEIPAMATREQLVEMLRVARLPKN